MEELGNVVASAPNGEMPFEAFVAEARAQGLRPELWLRASHGGHLHTVITDAGALVVRAGQRPEQGGAE